MIRLKESFARAKRLGLVGKKTLFAQEIWHESAMKAAYMNFLNLEQGKSKKIDIASVPILCDRLGVSADYLFGIADAPNREDYRKDVEEKAKEIISIAETL